MSWCSDISQGTDDHSAGLEDATKEWRTPENYINMSMGSNIVYTWASNTMYVMINGSEDGQSESLTGSTSAIMPKENSDQKTLFLRRFIVGVVIVHLHYFI